MITMNMPEPGDEKEPQGNERAEIAQDVKRTGVALSTGETVTRYGSANAEYVKGYTGVDNETGKKFAKNLKKISEGKINSDYGDQNTKQQAGYSAEVAATSQDNAKAIIEGRVERTIRGDDHPDYGVNHRVVDRLKVRGDCVIEGSQAQMKFVGDRDKLFKEIAGDDGKFSRYRGIKLELPMEQYDGAEQYCRDRANQLRFNATQAERHGRSPEIVAKLYREADNYDQLADNVSNSGLTTEDAIFYRNHPTAATALDIIRTSHSAGLEGAKYGSAIGGSISILTNVFAVAQNKKQLGEAAADVVMDVAKAAALGYGTAVSGAAIKGGMQQSSSSYLRTLSRTNAPVLALNICISLGSSIQRYVNDEISESELLTEVGEKGAGMLSSSMMAALGQVAIPVPFVGAAMGGMIGYTLSSFFYQSALDAARGADLSRQRLERIQAIELASRVRLAEEQATLDAFFSNELPQLKEETQRLFTLVNTSVHHDSNVLAAAINQYANLLGQQLEFCSQDEFNQFMCSEQGVRL